MDPKYSRRGFIGALASVGAALAAAKAWMIGPVQAAPTAGQQPPQVPPQLPPWSATIAGPFQNNVPTDVATTGATWLDHASYVYYRGGSRSFVALRFQLAGAIDATAQIESVLELEDSGGATITTLTETQPDARLNAAMDAALDFSPGTSGKTSTENSVVQMLSGAQADQVAFIKVTITHL